MPVRQDVFTGTGTGSTVQSDGVTSITMVGSGWGTGTVLLEVSFDQGATWKAYGSLTSNGATGVVVPPAGLLWRSRCSAYTSGSLSVGLAGGGSRGR